MTDQNTPAPADLVEAVKAAIHGAAPVAMSAEFWLRPAQAAIASYRTYMASDVVTQADLDCGDAISDLVGVSTISPCFGAVHLILAAHRRAAAITPQPDPRDAEIERLRETLKLIANINGFGAFGTIARAALAKSEGK